MNKLIYALVLCGLATASTAALADGAPASSLSGNIGIASDYIFRGISQTQHKPEISGGFDYDAGNGFSVGTWFSNQDWVDAGGSETNSSLEWDLYGAYGGNITKDLGYSVGVISYYYPGTRTAGTATPNTVEANVGLSWKMFSIKYSYTLSDYFVGWYGDNMAKTRGSSYLELNASYDLGNGWGVDGHVGHQKIKNWTAASYTDWKVGVSKDIGYGTVELAYSDTNADSAQYTWGSNPKDNSKGVAVLSFSKTF